MCRPLAIGSRQASLTISARCRGGNPGRPPGSVWWCQEAGQSRVLVAAANPPNRRAVALRAEGQIVDRFSGSDAQDDLCPLDLIPGEGSTAGALLQERGIVGSNLQNQRFATTHGTTPVAEVRYGIQHTGFPEFVALLAARDTSTKREQYQSLLQPHRAVRLKSGVFSKPNDCYFEWGP